MLKIVDGQTEGKHILFKEHPQPKRKTMVWVVVNRYEGSAIGYIGWFPKFRKFSFYPNAGTVYEEKCLRDIAEFCETETKKHTEKLRKAKQEKS